MRKTRIRKKTRTRTTTGSKLVAALVLLLTVCAVSLPLQAKKKEKPAVTASAVIAGTAFRPPGLSLPGARVRVRPEQQKDASGAKIRDVEAVTDGRGEFAIRVPAVPMTWTVNVSSSGYIPITKSVMIEGEQRVDLSLMLEPSKGESK